MSSLPAFGNTERPRGQNGVEGGGRFSCGSVLTFWAMSLGQSPCRRSRLTATPSRPPLAIAMPNGEGRIRQRQSCRTPSNPAPPLHIKSHRQQCRMGTVTNSVSDSRDDVHLYPHVVQTGSQQEMAAHIYKPCQSHVDNRRWANKRWQLFEATSRSP